MKGILDDLKDVVVFNKSTRKTTLIPQAQETIKHTMRKLKTGGHNAEAHENIHLL